MTIRLNSELSRKATEELLVILRANPDGMRTSELRGTPQFHGGRTLSSRQIIRLLRESGKATESTGGQGRRTYSFWKSK